MEMTASQEPAHSLFQTLTIVFHHPWDLHSGKFSLYPVFTHEAGHWEHSLFQGLTAFSTHVLLMDTWESNVVLKTGTSLVVQLRLHLLMQGA